MNTMKRGSGRTHRMVMEAAEQAENSRSLVTIVVHSWPMELVVSGMLIRHRPGWAAMGKAEFRHPDTGGRIQVKRIVSFWDFNNLCRGRRRETIRVDHAAEDQWFR